MENDNEHSTLGTRLEILRRRWRYPALITPACILLAVFLAYALTPLYRSSGTVMLEPSSVPKEYVELATTYADQQFELIQRRVMTRDNLEALVRRIDPYPHLPEVSPRDKAGMIIDATEIERVDPVTFETLQESNAFSIHYNNPDPDLAAVVTKELVALFLDYNSKTSRERAAATYSFLLAESGKMRDSIGSMEKRLAEFKSRYGDALPQLEGRNMAALDSARRDYDAASAQARVAEERVNQLQLQLNGTSPTLFGAVTDPRNELATLKAELAEAQKRYTPEHPDVRRLKAAVQLLLAEQRTTRAPTTQADNPEYLSVASQLAAAKRELSALRATASRASAQMQSYSRSLQMTPSVEREYAQLARDYTLAQEHFREIQGKLTEAELAQALVAGEQGERFTLIRNPGTPSRPYSPNRLGVILLGLVLGVALGFGAATIAELSDSAVRSARDLTELTGYTMIAAVPRLLNAADRRAQRQRWAYVGVGFGLACVAVFTAIISSG